MSKKVRITAETYQVIGLHGVKYAYAPIFGYLLGTEKGGVIDAQKAYPVSHNVPLAPLLELSAELAEKENNPQKILGVYYGLEVNTSSSSAKIPLYVERVAQNIRSVQGECVVLQLKESNFTDNSKSYVEVMNGYKLETLEDVQTLNASFNRAVKDNFEHTKINDFEAFLNSSGRDQLK